MKKIYAGLFLLLISFAARAQFPSPYCAEAFASGVEPITKVVFAGINNTSAAPTSSPVHENYTAIVGTVQQSSSYTIQVQGNTDGSFTDYIRLFADWNQDGDFDDAGESYNVGTITNSTGLDAVVVSSPIAVPVSALTGTTRIRVSKKWSAYAAPCNATGYGQAEDYTLTVTAASPCAGTPSGGAVTPSSTTLCTAGTVTLTSNASNAGTGISYQWQSSVSGANSFSDISGATATTYAASVTTSTDYRVRVICSGSGLSANSSIATVSISGPPANDSFCNPIVLTLNAAAVCGNTTCATSGYDPAFANSTPNNTVWYTYTPTTTGAIQARFKRPAGITTGLLFGWLGIYTVSGRCPGLTFTEVPSTLSYDLTTTDSVTVITPSLTAGTTYYFMVDGVSGAFGAYCIQLLTPPAPPACTTNITPTNGATSVTYLPSVQLTWNAVSGATGYDVYFGTSATTFTNLGTTTATTIGITNTTPNTTYYWYIAPRNATPATTCQSSATSFTTSAPPAPPANDSCGAAIALVPNVGRAGTTVGATQSAAAETCTGGTSTSALDVWYTINAIGNGNATITLTNSSSSLDAVLAAYSGTCSASTLISCTDVGVSGGNETLSLTGLVAGQTYIIRVYGWAGSTGTFTITAVGSALPVTGVNLTATRNGKNVQLGWQTLTEMNNTGFEIQRSADGSSYASFLKVASKANGGNSTSAINYTAEDVKPFSGAAYYRLKQTDKDGKINYSNVVFVKGMAVNNLTLSAVYPNPTHDVLKAAIQSPAAEKVTFVISDMMGKVISRQVSSVSTGDNTINLNVANLPSGNYLLKVTCSNGCETAVQKFTKQ